MNRKILILVMINFFIYNQIVSQEINDNIIEIEEYSLISRDRPDFCNSNITMYFVKINNDSILENKINNLFVGSLNNSYQFFYEKEFTINFIKSETDIEASGYGVNTKIIYVSNKFLSYSFWGGTTCGSSMKSEFKKVFLNIDVINGSIFEFDDIIEDKQRLEKIIDNQNYLIDTSSVIDLNRFYLKESSIVFPLFRKYNNTYFQGETESMNKKCKRIELPYSTIMSVLKNDFIKALSLRGE